MEYYLPKNFLSWSKIFYKVSKENTQYWNLENKHAIVKKHLLIVFKNLVYLIYCNIENDNLIIEKTLVNIDKEEKDNIWITGTIQNKFIFYIKNDTFSFLDNSVLIKKDLSNKTLKLFLKLDKNVDLTNNSKTKYHILEDSEGKFYINYILPKKNEILEEDYLNSIQIIKLFYKISFINTNQNPGKTEWYDYGFNFNKEDIKNCINFNLNNFKKFLEKNEKNKIYKHVLNTKLERFNQILYDKHTDVFISEKGIQLIKDICFDYYTNNKIDIVEKNYNEYIDLQKYEEIFLNQTIEKDGWQIVN